MTINELIETAHADAKAKGFWDEPRNTGELLMLIVSECGEALEAHRKGKRAELEEFNRHEMLHGPEVNKLNFEVLVKDTFEDELADIVIRIADLCGYEKMQLQHEPRPRTLALFEPKNTGELLLFLTSYIVEFYQTKEGKASQLFAMQKAFGMAFIIAQLNDIDLWRHIELKLAYNRTRPHKHGKAY